MLGALVGDINGSIFQYNNGPKNKKFRLFTKDMYFTDDSLLTIAVAEVLDRKNPFKTSFTISEFKKDLVKTFVLYVKRYKHLEYGLSFYNWAHGETGYQPYESFGNGAAMRISPVGWIGETEEEVKVLAQAVTEITHNHSDSYDAAETVSMAIFMARKGCSKEEIRKYVVTNYYPEIEDLEYNKLVRDYDFDITCKGTVPVAIYAFLISESFEDCLRTAISIGGDTDTLAAISMSIAEAYYYKRENLSYFYEEVTNYLDFDLYLIFRSFMQKYVR